MKPCGCEWCNNLINVQPARYIGASKDDTKFYEFIEKAKAEKQFIHIEDDMACIIHKCPVCGYEFTEEDYDSYL